MARAELGRAAPVRSTPSPSQVCVRGASLALCPADTYRRGQEQGLSGHRTVAPLVLSCSTLGTSPQGQRRLWCQRLVGKLRLSRRGVHVPSGLGHE